MTDLGKMHDELINISNTYNTPELHSKMLEFIQRDLPDKLESFLERKKRNEILEINSNAYINDFIVNSDVSYMFIPNSEIFIIYNGKHFKIINESEILHEILSGISQHKNLVRWKYKIKNLIMKSIKKCQEN